MVSAAVWTHSAAVVDEPGQVATLGGVYDGVVVHPEQVAAAYSLLGVALLSIVSHHLGNQKTLLQKPGQQQQQPTARFY